MLSISSQVLLLASLDMEDYVYSPLGDDEIRLLVLYPKPSGDSAIGTEAIESRIIHVPRDQPPNYEALSYCWGKTNVRHTIQVDGKTLMVGENLFSALNHLRGDQPDDMRHVWIDAICINQQDQEERGCQVLRMGSIYARACRVIIWLRLPPEGDTWISYHKQVHLSAFTKCLDLLYFVEHPDHAVKAVEAYANRENHVDDSDFYAIASRHGVGFLKTLAFILADPWFRRRWIVQELAFARNPVVQ
jgi:hypothetical protein